MPYEPPTPRQIDFASPGTLDYEVRRYGPADVPTGHSPPLRRAQRLDPPGPARRELAPVERGRAVPRRSHHDRVEVPSALRRARPRRASAARRPHVRVSTAVPPPAVRGESRGRGGTPSPRGRVLPPGLPLPLLAGSV